MAVGLPRQALRGRPRPRLAPDAAFALVLPGPATGPLLVGGYVLSPCPAVEKGEEFTQTEMSRPSPGSQARPSPFSVPSATKRP